MGAAPPRSSSPSPTPRRPPPSRWWRSTTAHGRGHFLEGRGGARAPSPTSTRPSTASVRSRARQAHSDHVMHKHVTLIVIDHDDCGRTVADLLDGEDVNLAMVRARPGARTTATTTRRPHPRRGRGRGARARAAAWADAARGTVGVAAGTGEAGDRGPGTGLDATGGTGRGRPPLRRGVPARHRAILAPWHASAAAQVDQVPAASRRAAPAQGVVRGHPAAPPALSSSSGELGELYAWIAEALIDDREVARCSTRSRSTSARTPGRSSTSAARAPDPNHFARVELEPRRGVRAGLRRQSTRSRQAGGDHDRWRGGAAGARARERAADYHFRTSIARLNPDVARLMELAGRADHLHVERLLAARAAPRPAGSGHARCRRRRRPDDRGAERGGGADQARAAVLPRRDARLSHR